MYAMNDIFELTGSGGIPQFLLLVRQVIRWRIILKSSEDVIYVRGIGNRRNLQRKTCEA